MPGESLYFNEQRDKDVTYNKFNVTIFKELNHRFILFFSNREEVNANVLWLLVVGGDVPIRVYST